MEGMKFDSAFFFPVISIFLSKANISASSSSSLVRFLILNQEACSFGLIIYNLVMSLLK